MPDYPTLDRRHFLRQSALAVAAMTTSAKIFSAGKNVSAGGDAPPRADVPARGKAGQNSMGAVAYSYNYSAAVLNPYRRRENKWDGFQFIDEVGRAGGEVAQFFINMLEGATDDYLRKLRAHAQAQGTRISLAGGNPLNAPFENTLRQAAVLGVTNVMCTFQLLVRPQKIKTLAEWDQYYTQCRDRLRALAPIAEKNGVVIALTNHLDLTTDELLTLMREVDSPHFGLTFDAGNSLGTLDDPLAAAEALGPYIRTTHIKDFAVEETVRGLRLTVVQLGTGNLRLPETIACIRRFAPKVDFIVQMYNGAEIEIDWLEEGFFSAFRGRSPELIARTLGNLRSHAFDRSQLVTHAAFEALLPEGRIELERRKLKACFDYLRELPT